MTDEKKWRDRYAAGRPPWDTGRPEFYLMETVERVPIRPGRTLEVGCGTGTNAVWLACRGFEVTGVDIAAAAVAQAREKAAAAKVNCKFVAGDFFELDLGAASFGFAFDRGCLHSCETDEEQRRFAEKVAALLEPGAPWLTLVGSADGPPRQPGPPRRTATELVSTVEPYFELVSLRAGRFDSNQLDPPKAWVCLLRKRGASQV